MSIPETVTAALADRPVEGAVCLEAGAGKGNTTRGLLDAGADHVYAVTNDREHARDLRDGLDPGERDRVSVLRGDLREIPLPDDAVDLVTAHGLFNVVPVPALGRIASELTRVAARGSHLVVDDYEPLPDGAKVSDLFAIENAASELAEGRQALTFYPSTVLRSVFVSREWEFDRERTLLDPVPWTESHVEAHADVVREAAETLPEEFAAPLTAEADRLAADIGSESVGSMYSLAFRSTET